MKFFSVIFTAALATAVLAAPVEVAERQVEAQGFSSGSEPLSSRIRLVSTDTV
jgi:hypothetical protein